jgi:hypothetical protein
MVACRRDFFSAKEPGLESADFATNVYSLNRRAVISHKIPAGKIVPRTIFYLN